MFLLAYYAQNYASIIGTSLSTNRESGLSVLSQNKMQVESVQTVCFTNGICNPLTTKLAALTPIITANNSKHGSLGLSFS